MNVTQMNLMKCFTNPHIPTKQTFQERDLLKVFKIPNEKLVSLLLTLEDHYLKVNHLYMLTTSLS